MQYCGWEGPLMNTLHSPVATVHADRAPQLSPALWLGDCLANGTSAHGWTQPKLKAFLDFLDAQGMTRVGVWCMTDGHVDDELRKWRTRSAAAVSSSEE